MMKKTLLQVFSLVLVLAPVGAVAFAARGEGDATDEAALKEIAGYKSWTRMTDAPVVVENFSGGG